MSNEKNKEYLKEYKKEYRKKTRKVEMSFYPNDYEKFQKVAKKLGYGNKTGTVVKEFALAYLDNRFIYPNELKEQITELTFLIRNIANNVNQLAHISNTQKEVLDQYEILKYIKEMDDNFKKFINKELMDN
jgi:hypothetical protein